ncbi:hypothetical protein [Streptococcus oriscaviae]|uniref:Uncharacterized protein n=1 Tax=Streptococcus oriscaviae TaxID=2781599 RepID=A0ABX7YIN7_9STRE|nr:hypothetical protein [Streptococcus oriscaviae]QUE53555.1 hypothetical protein INT76_06735 [Streptococcus oriscaviae]
MKALIRNPKNGRKAWFSFPFYFGKLSAIGHSCSYDDEVEIVAFEGVEVLPLGQATLYDLEMVNRIAEGI